MPLERLDQEWERAVHDLHRTGWRQMIERARKRLSKRAKKGFRGWPLATVALYGPDDSTATKLTVGIVPAEDAEATDLRRWFSRALSRRCAVEREGLAPQGTVRPLRPPSATCP
jgi:hypothetical protein